ncbi:magnesium chelatase subunit D [Oceanibium sediminis]|uniref:magnesium chelatase subunit D n=1 Tax=Oceanibium sediminis TaxID=2026339 RepID=UPI001E517E33|nr:magnesium chelatase subunit D [Oceanibium sediminis]
MTAPAPIPPRNWPRIPAEDWAAALLAVDPGLGGICLTSRAGPLRENWLAAALALGTRGHARVPVGAGEDRLFGGLDLAATLASGRPVIASGLVEEVGTGTLVVPMAERLAPGIAARLGQAWDKGAGFAVIALNEATEDEPAPPRALLDRLAFYVTPEARAQRDSAAPLSAFTAEDIAGAMARLPDVSVPDALGEALVAAAARLGIGSARAALLALAATRAVAALRGHESAAQEDAELATALVLAPRATRLPDQEEDPVDPERSPPPDDTPPPEDAAEPPTREDTTPPEDLLLAAARAAIPPDMLAQLAARGALARRSGANAAGAGEDQKGSARGRPAGTRRGDPRSGARLDLVATLRTAAPWQPLRRKMAGVEDRVLVTPEDFRVRQYKQKREKVVIFVVDASGSAAMTRLAETKGAIELMLAEAYVRREQVALIAFRGTGAELLLPPTRSLVQAKRRLSGLPGGGGTPLSAGLGAALQLADQVRRRGQTPHLAVMTDGRANVSRDGAPGRAAAQEEAVATARAIRFAGIAALLIDTAPRPQQAAKDMASALGALYLPMPRVDAQALSSTLRAALNPTQGAA